MAAFTECHLEREGTWLSQVSKLGLNLHIFCCWCNFCREVPGSFCSSEPVYMANPPELSNRMGRASDFCQTLLGHCSLAQMWSDLGMSVFCFLQANRFMASVYHVKATDCLVTVLGNPCTSGEALFCFCLLHPIPT